MKKLLMIVGLLSALVGIQVHANRIVVTNNTLHPAHVWVSWSGGKDTWYNGGRQYLMPGHKFEVDRDLLHTGIGGYVDAPAKLTRAQEGILAEAPSYADGMAQLALMGVNVTPVRHKILPYSSSGQAWFTDFEIKGPGFDGTYEVGRFVR